MLSVLTDEASNAQQAGDKYLGSPLIGENEYGAARQQTQQLLSQPPEGYMDQAWDAAKSVGGGLLTLLDSLGRPVRTLLDSGDVVRAAESITDPSLAPTATDIRRKYLSADWGNENEGWFDSAGSFGNKLVDLGMDIGTGALTDPATYLTLGATAVGKAASRAGQAAVAARRAGVPIAEVAANFAKATGKELPLINGEIASTFRGVEPTLAGRLKAGEAGLQIGLPGLHTEAKAINSGLGQVAALAASPIEAAADSALGRLIAAQKPVQWIGRQVEGIKNLIVNPAIRDAFGSTTRDVENQARSIAAEEFAKVEPHMNKLRELGVQDDGLMRDAMEALDPRFEGSVLDSTGKIKDEAWQTGELRKSGKDRFVKKLSEMNDAQRAATYSAVNAYRQTLADIVTRAEDELGINIPKFGQSVLDEPAKLQAKLNKLGNELLAAERELASAPASAQIYDASSLNDKIAKLESEIEMASGSGRQLKYKLSDKRNELLDAEREFSSNVTAENRNRIADIKNEISKLEGISSDPEKFISNARVELDQARREMLVAGDKGGSASANSAAAKRVKELRAEIDQLEKVDIPEAQRLANNVPGYFPAKLDDEAIAERLGESRGPSSGSINKQRSFTQGENGFGDARFKGVPASSYEAEQHMLKGGTGTAATRGQAPAKGLGLGETTDILRKAMTKDGFAKTIDEEVKAAAARSAFFDADATTAMTRYLTQDLYKTVRNKTLEKELVNAWGIAASSVKEATDLALQGKSLDEIKAAFSKATNGRNILNYVPDETAKRLADGTLSAREAFKAGWQPENWAKLAQTEQYVPLDVARRYQQYMESTTKNLPAVVGKAVDALGPFMRLWKKAQTKWFPSYHARNQIGDSLRMVQGDLVDRFTAGDYTQLFKDATEVAKNGYGKLDQFKNSQFYVGDAARKALGDAVDASGMISGETLMKEARRQGLINTGEAAQQMLDAAGKSISGSAKSGIAAATDMPFRLLAFREDANRLAGFLTRLRAGDDVVEAGMRVEETMFNQMRLSPAANFLRQTGIAPFISWPAKNIPFQIEYAIQHPGQFAAMLRGAELMQGGEIPPDLLPKYLQDKYQIILKKEKDANGREQWVYSTNSGVIPALDLVEMIKAPKDQAYGMLGPAMDLFLEGKDYDPEESKRPIADTIASALIGKPYQVAKNIVTGGQVDSKGQERLSSGAAAIQLLSPIGSVKRMDVQDQIHRVDKKRISELNNAKGAVTAAQAAYNRASLVYANEPDKLQALQNDIEEKRMNYWRLKQKAARDQAGDKRVLDAIGALDRAP